MNWTRLRERLRHDGPLRVAAAVAYRLTRAATGLTIVRVFELRTFAAPSEIDIRDLSVDDVRRFAKEDPDGLPAFLPQRIEAGLSRCLGIVEDGELAAFVWIGLGGFPPDWIYGPPLRIGPRDGYLYNAATRRDYRGRRLFETLAAEAVRRFELDRLLFTVEFGNTPSLKAARRMADTDHGWAVTFGTPFGRPIHVPKGLTLMPRPERVVREGELPPASRGRQSPESSNTEDHGSA